MDLLVPSKTMWRFFLLNCSIVAALDGFKVRRPIRRCIMNPGPLPLGAEVDGCTNSPPPCILTDGTVAFIPIAFTVPIYTSHLTTSITTYQMNQRVVTGLPHDLRELAHTCNYLLDASCPVRQGEILLYPLQMPVNEPNFQPGEVGAMEIRILNDRAEPMVCLRVEFAMSPSNDDLYLAKINRLRKSFLMHSLYNRM